MAVTVSEASAINTLIRFITGTCSAVGAVPDSDTALRAANLLAGSAHKRLMAGLRGDGDLDPIWPRPVPGAAASRPAGPVR